MSRESATCFSVSMIYLTETSMHELRNNIGHFDNCRFSCKTVLGGLAGVLLRLQRSDAAVFQSESGLHCGQLSPCVCLT